MFDGSVSLPSKAFPLQPDNAPRVTSSAAVSAFALGGVNGWFFDQDRVAVVRARMADATRADEIVMTAQAARALGSHTYPSHPENGVMKRRSRARSGRPAPVLRHVSRAWTDAPSPRA